ncbi:transmembrane protein 59-like [Ruditapes philippinarum]|uniref:transmembrane protein 59-like n=1 Tax=Ruditapes philippinarum TaxID=129788 RepID=UPI00295BCA0D|nr:transmembrane protein 59-like [Ruditapes philippinarum]
MATKQVVGYFLLIFVHFARASQLGFPDDASSCKEVCKNAYSPHTYEKSTSEESCDRGCRWFSMMEFLCDDVNKTIKVCQSSCKDAFSDNDDFEACKLGCISQKPFSLDSILKVIVLF